MPTSANTPATYPHQDHTEHTPNGRVRRYWTRRNAWRFADSRDRRGGRGHRGGHTRPWYADHPHMPAVRAALTEPHPPTGTELSRRLGIPVHTARRLLKAAREQQS